MDIYFTKDNILNSKSEYVKNCISRLTVGEQDWERKERERQEELDELVEKDEVEKFKQDILRKRKIRDYEKTRDREEENESKRESANTPPPSKSSEEEADVSSHEEYKDESTGETNEQLCEEPDPEVSNPGEDNLVEKAVTSRKVKVTDDDTSAIPGARDKAVTCHTEVLPDLIALSVAANLDDEVPGISLDVGEDKALDPSKVKCKRGTRREEKTEYKLAWWSLWWLRMEREGKREEEVRELELERRRCSNQMMRYLNQKKIVCESTHTIPGPIGIMKTCNYLTSTGGKESVEKDAESCYHILSFKRKQFDFERTIESPVKKKNKIILEKKIFGTSRVNSWIEDPQFLQATGWD